MVDCASALKQSGHVVHFFTNYHDRAHCYEETRDGTLPVTVYGQTSDNLFGKFRVLIAILRMIWLTIVFAWRHARDYDVVIVDQVSHSIPILTWFTRCRVLFYCHFPDQLLAQRTSLLKRVYRWPFDRAEEWTTGQAHRILVNSQFTRATFRATFTRLAWMVDEGRVDVLYPSIDFARYKFLPSEAVATLPEKSEVALLDEIIYGSGAGRTAQPQVLLLTSINRFERKKNIKLAIAAYALFQIQRTREAQAAAKALAGEGDTNSSAGSPPARLPVRLLVCGGYDPANLENVDHFLELRHACEALDMRPKELRNEKDASGRVTLKAAELIHPTSQDARGRDVEVYFLRSFTDAQRAYLLSHSLAVLYTPSNEHFGIVPVEAMYMRRPVVACRSGGPMESVVDYHQHQQQQQAGGSASPSKPTGFLCQPSPTEWRDTMRIMVEAEEAARRTGAPSLCHQLGEAGREHVLKEFHFATFQRKLIRHVQELMEERKTQ